MKKYIIYITIMMIAISLVTIGIAAGELNTIGEWFLEQISSPDYDRIIGLPTPS